MRTTAHRAVAVLVCAVVVVLGLSESSQARGVSRPTGVKVATQDWSQHQLRLTWRKVTGARYQIRLGHDQASLRRARPSRLISSNARTLTLSRSHSYKVQVRAVRGHARSAWSTGRWIRLQRPATSPVQVPSPSHPAPTSEATPEPTAPTSAPSPTSAPTPTPSDTATQTPPPAPAPTAPAEETGTSPSTPATIDLLGAPLSSSLMRLLGWAGTETPRPGSITTLDPFADTIGTKPAGPLMRVELRPGELYHDPGYAAPRAEVYGRTPTWWSDPASSWPDPPGSERWYDFSLMVPKDFPVASDARWLVLTQWKGLRGGSPPLALDIKRSGFRLGGTRTNQGLVPNDGYLGPIDFGRWTRFTVGVKYATSSSAGWVQVFRDGKPAIPRLALATMDTVNGQPDPIYLKQGVYRDSVWDVTQALYFSPLRVTTSAPAGM